MPGETEIELQTLIRQPFAGGAQFGDTGEYERLSGTVVFAVDPNAPAYKNVVDLANAPLRSDGRVEFSTDFYLLKPVDLARGNRRLFYDVANRGTKLALSLINDAIGDEQPDSLEHAGNGFLMRRGYSILWSGWQGDITPGDGRLCMQLPVAQHQGQPITGTVRTEFAPGYQGTGYFVSQTLDGREGIFCIPLSGNDYTQSYAAVSLDTSAAALTCREYETDPRQAIDAKDWSFAKLSESGSPEPSPTHCFLPSGFKRGWIYELIYTAKDPLTLGLGFTATRDLISFLRHDATDSTGHSNPLRQDGIGMQKAYGWGCSQSARYLREFVYRGYNADAHNRPVFDAINPFVSGAGRVTLNYRFAQPGRYPRQHFDHLFASDQFPFAYPISSDLLTGETDGILKRPATDPYVIHTQNSSEYWQRRGSLVHTDSEGNDLPDHEKSRVYLLASAEHAADPVAGPVNDLARYPTNPLNVSALQRAMLDNLDDWVSRGTQPPDSRVPKRSDKSAVLASEIAAAFPRIPEVAPPGGPNRLFVQDHGGQFKDGYLQLEPPREDKTREYTVLLPMIDENGNELAGIRGVELEVPTATYTGWNYRKRGEAEQSMAAVHGSYLPFAPDAAARRSTGDSRLSIEERYASNDEYVRLVSEAVERLVEQRLLLREDAQRFVTRAMNGFEWKAL